MRKPLIAGNWKMNLNHLEAIAVTQKLASVQRGNIDPLTTEDCPEAERIPNPYTDLNPD